MWGTGEQSWIGGPSGSSTLLDLSIKENEPERFHQYDNMLEPLGTWRWEKELNFIFILAHNPLMISHKWKSLNLLIFKKKPITVFDSREFGYFRKSTSSHKTWLLWSPSLLITHSLVSCIGSSWNIGDIVSNLISITSLAYAFAGMLFFWDYMVIYLVGKHISFLTSASSTHN